MESGEYFAAFAPFFFGCLFTFQHNLNRMEKLRLEASTHLVPVSAISPCLCAVCGLVLITQLPLFAAESAPQIAGTKATAPKSAKAVAKPTNSPQTLRPMAFRRTTAAPSQAKSQVARAGSTPLQSLKPTVSSPTTRFALTAPAAARTGSQAENRTPVESQQVAAEPSERIVMTALPVDDAPAATSALEAAPPVASGKIEAVVQTTQTDILDSVAFKAAIQKTAAESSAPINEGDSGEGEPLTGTVTLPQEPVETQSVAPSQPPVAPVESGVIVPDTAQPDAAGSTAITADSKAAQTSRLFAPSISYEGGTIIAEGTEENPVRLEGAGTRIIARSVRLDTINKLVSAAGSVRVERQVTAKRFSAFNSSKAGGGRGTETVTETLQGENFEYNYGTREGKLGATRVRLANLNISAEEIIINGTKYIARNVVIRPGGLSDEELRIYGTPPFSIRAKMATVDTSKSAPPNNLSSDTTDDIQAEQTTTARTQVRGAGLYFKNFRILPIPSALLARSLGDSREEATYQLTPRIAFNSADGVLVTVGLKYPFSPLNPDRLTLTTDIGLSAKVGFRGGAALDTNTKIGRFAIGARINDVISSQLTNRIELDRLPEATYEAPRIALFALPGGRRAGLQFEMSAGDYRERFTTGNRAVQSSRVQGQLRLTTRMGKKTGPYLDLLARAARYSRNANSLTTAGFEVGYAGAVGSRITGRFSYGASKVNGETPFEFDKVIIEKELRATFDILLTPRYIIPIDLRYDLGRQELRERTFGILRNYKTFAYGVTYQSSRQELQFQVRQGF